MELNTTDKQVHTRRFSSREIEVISGLLAGFSTTIVTHPLDVIKIRLQLSRDTPKTTHPLESIISVIKKDKPRCKSSIQIESQAQGIQLFDPVLSRNHSKLDRKHFCLGYLFCLVCRI